MAGQPESAGTRANGVAVAGGDDDAGGEDAEEALADDQAGRQQDAEALGGLGIGVSDTHLL